MNVSEFNTERFIIEVEGRPTLWNFESTDYSYKHLKNKAWEDVSGAIYTDYEGNENADFHADFKIIYPLY